jgi:predicted membrane-bound dolichyl-phosphate-mannose-protein mannosyltransferase
MRMSRVLLSTIVRPFKAAHPCDWGLALVVAGVAVAHVAIANLPTNAFIFDEAYYVPAARELLAGLPSNIEHPPLAKALIALSIRIFGDVAFAWRLPSIVFGTLSLVVLYELTRRLADRRTALLAAFLLGFESLWFVHSSIAMLDIPAVAIALLALLVFVREQWVWAGALVGVSMLAKETTVLLVGVLPLFVWARSANRFTREAVRQTLGAAFFVAASALMVFLAGMQVYDWLYSPYPTAFHHVAAMLHHNNAIAAPPAADAVRPFQWFSGFAPSGYLLTFADVGGGMKRYYVQYFGQPNLVVVLLIWLALPFSLPALRRRDPNITLHALLFAASIVFFVAISAWRITYPYYMLIALPSLCVLCAGFLAELPRAVVVTYAVGVLMWFLAWFPRNLLTLWMK